MTETTRDNRLGKVVFVAVALLAVACYVFYQFFFVVDIDYPLRAPKVKVGDWFLFKLDGKTMRETATKIEKRWGDILVEYRIDFLDDAGTVVESRIVGHSLSQEKKNADDMRKFVVNRPELIPQLGLENDRKTVRVGGREVTVTSIRTKTPHQETWFSDEFSVNGRVAFLVEGKFVMEPLDFGGGAE